MLNKQITGYLRQRVSEAKEPGGKNEGRMEEPLGEGRKPHTYAAVVVWSYIHRNP